MRKRRSDSDIMIDVLEEASRRSHSDEPFEWKQYGPAELAIILDLIEAGKVRGQVRDIPEAFDPAELEDGTQSIPMEKILALTGITLSGRQLRDELIAKRDEKKFVSRLKKAGWAALGSIGTMVIAYLKAKIVPN
jgi:hypothetical protein